MNKHIITLHNIKRFVSQCFDRGVEQASRIIKGILSARSPRLSDISNNMEGNPSANYKAIQRFIEKNDAKKALYRLYDYKAEFIIGDPVDIDRPQANKTEYVGKLKDGKLGFQVLVLSFPYRGRAIPFSFITYSSKTIDSELTSRNLQHEKAIEEVKELIEDKPIVLDREFSYEGLLLDMVENKVNFVIRLNTGIRPTILDENGEKVSLSIGIGEERYFKDVYYKGKVKVNIAGKWKRGFSEPIWVMSSLPPEKALEIFSSRMKIDESFKDLKDLLNLDKIMNKKRGNMEKVVALVLLAYSIGLLIGEEIRDKVYGGRKKWALYSGLFILLKQKIRLAKEVLAEVINRAFLLFSGIVSGGVRTHV